MRYTGMVSMAFLSAALWLGVAGGAATGEEQKPLKDTFDRLLPGMGADQNYEGPQREWQEVCFQAGAPGNEARRAEAARLMAEKLVPATPARARAWMLKQLEWIGRGECVDAVATQLNDSDPLVRDAARRAMAQMPVPEANAKLLAALAATADAKSKVGLITALGYRADRASTAALVKELGAQDQALVLAAAKALGRIGSQEAAVALSAARERTQGEMRLQIADAQIRCADKLLKDGKTPEAAAIYRALRTNHEAPSTRLAALEGAINTAGDQAGGVVLEVLAGGDAGASSVAVGQVLRVNANALSALCAGLGKLPPPAQIALLGALACRKDTAAMPAVAALAKAEDEKLRTAALKALGSVGDASVVPMLVETMLAGGPFGGPAREALEAVDGDGADMKLIEIMKSDKDPGRRCMFIEILDRRRAVLAVPALLEEAASDNPDVRRRAMGALGRLAKARDVGGMIRAMAPIKDRGERDEAERAVAAVCIRIPDEAQRADPVLAALNSAPDAQKNVLLGILGRIGCPKGLEAIRAALASGDEARFEAGLNALCNWPDADAAEDLVKIAETAQKPQYRSQAVMAFARMIAVRDEFLNDRKVALEKLNLVKRAMKLADRKEEKQRLLERAANLRHVETLRFVAPYLDDPELAQQACRTVVELAHHRDLREPDKAEFEKALDKVIAVCKDNGLVDRAKQYKAGR